MLPMTRPQLKLKNGARKRRAGMSSHYYTVNGLMMRFGGLLAVNNINLNCTAGNRLVNRP
ncbi:hypothetical protein ACVXHB_07180 [Escherichia coli]